MFPFHPFASAAGGNHHSGGVQVPASTSLPPAPGVDPAQLTQAERAARALDEDGRARPVSVDRAFLESALDLGRTLRTLVAAVVPRLADWCFVDLVDPEGIPRRVEVGHADPAQAPLAGALRESGSGPGWATPGAQAIRDRAPRLYRELSDELVEWATHDERHLAALRAIHPASMLAVPLVARDRAIGALTLVRTGRTPGLDEAALVEALEVAAPAALAIDDARWIQAERTARVAAEDLADRERSARLAGDLAQLRLRRLEALSASFTAALGVPALACAAVETGLSLLEPQSAAVAVATRTGRLEIVYAHGWPDASMREGSTLRADDPGLLAEAFRIQTAIWLPSEEALGATFPAAAVLCRYQGDHAFAAAPLRVDGRSVGALSLAFAKARELDGEERRYVLTVAQLLAGAVERARLRDAAKAT
jgi:GAF domain-containing protein